MKLSHAFAAVALSAVLSVPAQAGGSHTAYGAHGGYISKSHSSNGTTASRSIRVQGAYGGSASLSGSCTKGAGCTRNWSRTLRNGSAASGSVTAQRGVGVRRNGIGFRGRKW